MLEIQLTDEIGIFPKKTLELDEGITVLIGCNGSGKSTLLHEIRDVFEGDKDYVFLGFDNEHEGGIHELGHRLFRMGASEAGSFLLSSEGERIYATLAGFIAKLGSTLEKEPKGKPAIITMDAVDSGFSLDNIIELRHFFEDLINEFQAGRKLYIVIASNAFATCKGAYSIDVTTFQEHYLVDYNDFERIIMESRERKDERNKKTRKNKRDRRSHK